MTAFRGNKQIFQNNSEYNFVSTSTFKQI